MFSSSSSSDSDDALNVKDRATSRSTLKSLFAANSMEAKHGVTSLRYEDASKQKSEAVHAAATTALPSVDGGSNFVSASQAVVMVYRGSDPVGTCAVVLCAPNVNAATALTPFIAVVDRERRPHARVKVAVDMQLLQNREEKKYATLYDANIGGHWTLLFRSARECTQFIVSVYTTLHFVMQEEGPASAITDIFEGSASSAAAQVGDSVSVSTTTWLVSRVSGSRCFSTGKIVEEIPAEAPRTIVVGDGDVMVGVDEALVNLRASAQRIVFVNPKKTKVRNGLGNPEVQSGDSVVALVECHAVLSAAGNASTQSRGRGQQLRSLLGDNDEEDLASQPGGPTRNARSGGAANDSGARNAVAVPSAVGAGGSDVNTLLQAMLLQSLQQKQQQPEPAGYGNGGPWNEMATRMLDRVLDQLSSLSDRVDKLGVEDKLTKNNQVIERIVKKAVGKLPVNDVDLEDVEKDRGELLASIERLKGKLEEATGNYHRALEAMGRHKDEVRGLENDIAIQRTTLEKRLKEVEDLKRLQLVEIEVKHRQALDRVSEEKYEEGKRKGYADGLQAGRVEALESVGSNSTEEMREKLFLSEQRIVKLESEIQQLQSKRIEETRGFKDQIQSLNDLIKRYEKRDLQVVGTGIDATSRQCKVLRRAMNATYTNIESQLYAFDKSAIPVEDALRIALVAIKSETRTFTEEIKREATLRAAEERRETAAKLLEQQRIASGDLGDDDDVYTNAAEDGETITPFNDEGIRAYLRSRELEQAHAVSEVLKQSGIMAGKDARDAASLETRADNTMTAEDREATKISAVSAASAAAIHAPPLVFGEDGNDGAPLDAPHSGMLQWENGEQRADWPAAEDLPPPPPAPFPDSVVTELPPPQDIPVEECDPAAALGYAEETVNADGIEGYEETHSGGGGGRSQPEESAAPAAAPSHEGGDDYDDGPGESETAAAPTALPTAPPPRKVPLPRAAHDDDDDEW